MNEQLSKEDWRLIFELGAKMQADLYLIWETAKVAIDIDPETKMPRIHCSAAVGSTRARYIHFVEPEDWKLIQLSAYPADAITEVTIKMFRRSLDFKV